MVHDIHRQSRQVRCRRIQPVDTRIPAKPSHLFTGQAPGIVCDTRIGFIFIYQPVAVIYYLPVSQGFYGGRAETVPYPAHFIGETGLPHPAGPQVYTFIKVFPGKVEAYLDSRDNIPVMGQRSRIRLPCKGDDFQRTDGPADIVPVHTGSSVRVFPLKLSKKRFCTNIPAPLFNTGPYLRVSPGERDIIDRCPCIQPRTADQHRRCPPGLDISDTASCKLLEPCSSHRFLRADDINKMMFYFCPFLHRSFCSTNIHAAVHLISISVDDLGSTPFFFHGMHQRNCQSSFP